MNQIGKKLREVIEHPNVKNFDDAAEELVEPLRHYPAANHIFYKASELGNHSIIWHIVNLIQTVLFRDPIGGIRTAIALGIESALINGPVKTFFRRERPVHNGEHPHTLRKPKTSSFPSGHATSAFCAAAMFSKRDPARRGLYYLLACIVSTSRVHVKIHHASDVVAGATIGVLMGAVAKRFLRSR